MATRYKEEAGRSISYGTLYTTFRRLREAGWVDSRDDDDQDGRVRYFRLLGAGARALMAGRRHYAALADLPSAQDSTMTLWLRCALAGLGALLTLNATALVLVATGLWARTPIEPLARLGAMVFGNHHRALRAGLHARHWLW